MKRYVRFTDADAALLGTFRPHASQHFVRIAAEFYDRIREHEAAHAVFTSEAQIDRLKRSLVRWLDRVFSGKYDETYFLESAKIGRVHVRVGLPQHYMFTAMALIRVELIRIVHGARETEVADKQRLTSAVERALDLELAIMLETYRDDLVARIERAQQLERAEVDRTLARTEHRYRHAVELAKVIIVGLDAKGTIVLFNAEAERVTGYWRDEVIGRTFAEVLLPPEIAGEEGAGFPALPSAGPPSGPAPIENVIRTKAGHLRDVRWQLGYAPHEDDDVMLFAVGLDITEQNALATRALQNEKLAAIGTLAAGLAHEIRNPLNGAHLHLTFLDRGLRRASITDPDTLDAVRVVDDEIKRLANLVTEFLEFARPRPLTKKPVELRGLSQRIVQLAASNAAAAHVTLVLDLPDADVTIDADGAKIEQVLLNLVHNAIEAMAPLSGGNATLRVRKHPRVVHVEVDDQGPGIPDDAAPIFDPFYSTKESGTGLGLAIVHRIVTDHGGTIDFKCSPGKTTFRVILPLPGWDNARMGATT
ncbi:MAG: PAS domain S-box protein [Polyangiaceae bacterium]|nr:PAS domain S-box protein [Polyangiaceae bacterium]